MSSDKRLRELERDAEHNPEAEKKLYYERFRVCEHKDLDRVGSSHLVCYNCKWLFNFVTHEWEPL